MSLEIVKQLNVDLHDTKYIQVNAKQYDRSSRIVEISCCNQGKLFPIDNDCNYAYIRYKKPDELGVFNKCEITDDGKILIELSEQMLAVSGKCYADLLIVHNESTEDNVDIDKNTGELIIKNDSGILSTMIFCINVIGTCFDNTEIESSYEYNALNDLLIKANTDYAYVINACRISEENAKESENNAKISESNAKISENNSKKYENNAKISESNAKISENNASVSADNAKTSEDNAKVYSSNAKSSELSAKVSEDNAKTSEQNTKESEVRAFNSSVSAEMSAENAKVSEINAKTSEINSKVSEENAKTSEQNTSISELNAKESENISVKKALEASQSASESAESAAVSVNKATESSDYAKLSKSYAMGNTGVRENEDVDNSQYYYIQTKAISDSIDGSFIPMGSIDFSQLKSVAKESGYVYHINDNFTTDDSFKCGAGIFYPSGTNVYYTSDGYWDCFVSKELYGDLNVVDDNNGNVEIIFTPNETTISYDDYNVLKQTITELQDRIKALEE